MLHNYDGEAHCWCLAWGSMGCTAGQWARRMGCTGNMQPVARR
jgi:hypothetical protein